MRSEPDALKASPLGDEAGALQFLLHLSDRLRDVVDPVQVALQAAGMLGEHLGVPRCGYGEIDGSERIVSVKRDWTDGSIPSLAGEARILDPFGSAVIAELRAGRTLVVEDCLRDPRVGPEHAATWASIGTRALVVVPLIKGGRLRAILYLHEPHPRTWTEAEIALARQVAERTWDTVERARVEAELRDSEQRHRALFEQAAVGVAHADLQGRWRMVNERLCEILDYSRAELLERSFRSLTHPDDVEGDLDLIRALDAGEVPSFRREKRYIRKDGSITWAEVTVSLVRDESGAPDYRVAIIHKIHDRKLAEEALRASESRLRLALDAGRMSVWESDTGKDIVTSPELNRLFGFSPDATPTIEEIRSRYAPGSRERLRAAAERAIACGDRYAEEELELVLPDGSHRWLLLRAELEVTPGADQAEPRIKALGVALDITARKRLEEHQRLLINELNHRVKNTLATVQSVAAQSFRGIGNSASPEIRAFEERLFALSRAHDVLTRENWDSAELHDVVTEVLEPYLRLQSNRFTIHGPHLRLAPRMALALAMALHELATNAAKYGALSRPDQGRVEITWTLTEDDPPQFCIDWKEVGGPPVEPPTRKGFGTRLIERMLASDLSGHVALRFEQTGVECTIRAPLRTEIDTSPDRKVAATSVWA